MGWKRWVAAADYHGDRRDQRATKMFLEFCSGFMPHVRVLAGDLFDFRSLRRKASEDERACSLEYDLSLGMDFLREGFRPHVFLRGNHDERLWTFAREKTGPLKDLAFRGIADIEETCERSGTTMVEYDRRKGVFRMGDLAVLHGYGAGVYAVRKHAFSYGKSLIGHTHSKGECGVERLDGARCWEIGCLCQLDQDYNAATMASLRHAHSWAYGWWNEKTGVTHPFLAAVDVETGALFAPTMGVIAGDDDGC